jgi:gamma-glutamyltranspeptidase/glutathione hydrolase
MYHHFDYPFASRRFVKYSTKGMCATSSYLAAQSGLDILKQGGNAIDAAIAMATSLTVLEPQSNGIGGDAFAIIWTKNKLFGLNASGWSPAELTSENMRTLGYSKMPLRGFSTVTVPGAPSAWDVLIKRFGKLSLSEVMKSAITYAHEGFAATSAYCRSIGSFSKELKEYGGEEFEPWYRVFTPNGHLPEEGQIVQNLDASRTLSLISQYGAEVFYKGELAEKIGNFSQKHGGYIRFSDLAEYEPEWVEPISVNYRGYNVWEIPPNGQGIVALMALNILNGFEPFVRDDLLSIHRQIEAIKLAYVDVQQFITDACFMETSVDALLSPEYATVRRGMIQDIASFPVHGTPPSSGTVYLCVADNEGNMISYIQSNFKGFGSGIVIPGTGIALQNRGIGFNLTPGHINELSPRKKPYHTIIPGFLTRDGNPIGPFGVMGGHMQPQGHVQVVQNLIDCGLNPQSCLDAPRWRWEVEKKVLFEREFPSYILNGLQNLGHHVGYDNVTSGFGRGQMILNYKNGVLIGGTEPRCEGDCAAW